MDFNKIEDNSGLKGSYIILSIFFCFIFILLGFLIYTFKRDQKANKKYKKRR